MKPQEHWLSRNEAVAQLGVSHYRFDAIVEQHGLKPAILPGLRRPKYRESDLIALRGKLEKEGLVQ